MAETAAASFALAQGPAPSLPPAAILNDRQMMAESRKSGRYNAAG
jgi:hypothetical protein